MTSVSTVKKRTSARRAPPGGTPRRRHRRLLEAVLLLAGFVMMMDALFGEKGVIAMMRAQDEYRGQEQRLAAAKAQNARLRAIIQSLYEPQAIEDAARRDLGLIKPGEKVFIIKDVPPASEAPATVTP
jgi:cell division protein FtsB